ncbi:MAG: Protoglobin [Candidatus Nitrotoga sp. CP45]|nr:MAG: Protoglobin [Candidatus Nitrotoga sp. CP45]
MKNRLLSLALSICFSAVAPNASAHSGSDLTTQTQIPGYTFGQKSVATAPYTLKDLESLKKTLLFTDEDVLYLRKSKEILAGQTDAILDVWYGFVASTPELVEYFKNTKTGQPDGDYLGAVRKRFGQWILDTADANYDQAWLDYQYEIGLRHTKIKKNKTDHVKSVPQVNFRYLPALTIPVTTTLKPFLAKKGVSTADVEKMHAAWVKSVLLQTILWSYPYVRDGQF